MLRCGLRNATDSGNEGLSDAEMLEVAHARQAGARMWSGVFAWE